MRRPREERCARWEARVYVLRVSVRVRVGVYRPVGVLRAMLMSACGRTVMVGFGLEVVGLLVVGLLVDGVMEERKSGQSCIARASIFKRKGR